MHFAGYTRLNTITRKKLVMGINWEIPIFENDGRLGIVSLAKICVIRIKRIL